MSELYVAIESYNSSVVRAAMMSQLREIADRLDATHDERNHLTAHLLRCVWIATHMKRGQELYDLVAPVVDQWLDEAEDANKEKEDGDGA